MSEVQVHEDPGKKSSSRVKDKKIENRTVEVVGAGGCGGEQS